MTLCIILLFFIFFSCYKKAAKIYTQESIFFYRVIKSKHIRQEIKHIALLCHKKSFSPFMWFIVLIGIILLPFSKKQTSYTTISQREIRIIGLIMLRYFHINITFMFPFYIITFAIGLIWLFLCKVTLSTFPVLITQIINKIYIKSLKTQKTL